MMAAKLKYPANQNIRDLPGKIMIEVRDALDTRSVNNVSAWRAFASRLKGRFHYKYVQAFIFLTFVVTTDPDLNQHTRGLISTENM